MKSRSQILLFFILFLNNFVLHAADRYWIGGTGSWSQTAHWSATSGGPTVGAIPTAADNVIFDANSGLSAATTVTLDVAVNVVNFTFSAAPNFTFASALSSITITGNLVANSTATLPSTITINMFSAANTASLTSNGRSWTNDFILTASTNVNGVSLTDAFVSNRVFTVTRGKFNTSGNNFSVLEFRSPTGQTRAIDLTNSAVSVTGSTWRIEAVGITLTTTGSTINLTNAGTVTFFGGGLTYNTLTSSSSTLRVERSNTFGNVTLATSSTLLLDSVQQTFTTLAFAGTCLSNGIIAPIFPASPAPQVLVSTSPFTASYLSVTKVNALAPTAYNLTNSNVTNSTGWSVTNAGGKFYWINNSGNWTDGSHWSNTSGGAAINCIPNAGDSVFFDANSFSLPDQTVTVNTNGYYKSMKWTNILASQTLLLDSVNATNSGNLFGFGDMTLHANVKVRRVESSCAFEFGNAGTIAANGANIDANFRINMPTTAAIVLLSSDLIMSDTSSLILLKGVLTTQNNKLTTGTFRTLNDPTGTADTRTMNLGTSSVHIVRLFQSDNDPEFTLNAGTSNVYVGDTIQYIPDTLSYLNGLLTSGSTFHNVTLNFQKVKIGTVFLAQKVTGNNTFNKLKILGGSRVSFANGSTQIVNDTLFFNGKCSDSITVLSDGAGQFNINKADTKVRIECTYIEDLRIVGTAQTAYYSVNVGNNTNITFNTSQPVTATFTSTSPDCFGDVTTFTPSASTPIIGETISYVWQFNDGSTQDYPTDQYSGSSSTVPLTFVGGIPGESMNDTLQVGTWTEITDPSGLFFPSLNNGTGYPSSAVTSMRFDFDASFTFSLENQTGADAYIVDMNNNPFKVKYKYRPQINVVKNGTLFSSVYLTSSTIDFSEDTLANGNDIPLGVGSTPLITVDTNVSLILNNLQPTDVLQFYTTVQVSFTGYSTKPRWKNAPSTSGTDVSIGYKMNYTNLDFVATPFSNNLTGNTHTFNDRGDIPVSLIAINPVNGCTDTMTTIVTINGPISYLSIDQDTSICSGDMVEFTASTSGDATTQFTFFVNGTSVQGPGLVDSLLLATLANNDIVTVQTTNGGCTSVNDPSFEFLVYDLPVYALTIDDNDTICAGDTITFSASGANNLFRYKKNSNFVNAYSNNGTYVAPSLVNNDVITLFVKSTVNGCIADSVIPITVNPKPTVTMSENSGDFLICQGDPVTFTGLGAIQYEYFINGVSLGLQASGTIIIDTLSNGDVVTLQGYNANGCKDFAPSVFTYTVISQPNATISINPGLTVCSGAPVTVTGSGATMYQFFIDGVSQGPASFTNSINSSSYTTGMEFYLIGTANGCSKISDTLTLTVNNSPTTTLNSSDADNIICNGTMVTFTASGATSYQFFLNGVLQGSSSTYSSSTLSNGNVITVTGTSNGCPVSQSITMTVNSNPNVLLFSNDADNTVCSGQSITFTGANAASYVLSVNGVPGASQTSPTFVQTLPVGTNTISVTGTSSNGCFTTSPTITAIVNPYPTVSLNSSDADNIICSGTPVTFTGNGANQYQFFVNATAQGSMSATNTFTTSGLTNGQTVTVVGSSLGCSTTSAGIPFTVNSIPPVTLISDDANNQFCQGDVVTFSSAGATSYEFFVNGVSQGAPSGTSTINGSSFTPGSYPVSVIGSANGCSSTALLNVIINANPVPTLNSNDIDNTICAGQTVTYTATGGNTYQFTVNGTPQGSPSPLNSFNTSTLLNGDIVGVIATSSQLCSTPTAFAAITVNPIPTVTINSSDVDQQICVGDNVTFTGAGATNYEFFVNGTSQGAASPVNTFSTSALTNGQTVQVAGSSLGCTATTTPLTFLVLGPPAVQLFNNASLTVCTGQAVDLTANGATNYQFLVNGVPTGGFTANPNFTNSVNNGDVVTVVGESNGCINPSSDSYTFTVNSYPTLASSSSVPGLVICLNDPVTITSNGASTYLFEINGNSVQNGSTNTFTTSTLENGDVINVTGFNGNCASTPSTFTFTVNEMNLSLTTSPSNMICQGEAVSFTATGGNQYEFFVNGVSQGPLSSTWTFNSSTLADGDEVSMIAYSTATGCTQTDENYILMDVMDAPAITADSGPDFCQGDSVVLTSNFNTGNQWYINGAPIAGATDSVYVVYDSGDYSVNVVQGGNGELWSFGLNAQGIFADGSNLNSVVPVEAAGGNMFTSVSSGQGFMIGLTPTGTVYAWGENSSGQLGNGTFTSSNTPLVLPSLSGITSVATTYTSAMAVTNTGNVYVWGNNSVGQLATGNTSVINFPYQNPALTNVDTVAAGRSHVVILKNDGTVWTSGSNDYGQLGNGTLTGSLSAIQVSGLTGITRIGAGEYSSFAMNAAGDLYVWGNNGSGQLGLNDIVNRLTPTLSGLRNIVHAEGGAAHSVFLAADSDLYTSGDNTYGQLGDGTNNSSTVPVQIALDGTQQVSAGEYTTLILRGDRSVYACGSNIENQISADAVTSYSTPYHINSVHGVGFVEASITASHFIYEQLQACTSNTITLNELPVPVVTITNNSGVLTTVAGVSYQWYFNGAPVFEGTNQSFTPLENGYYSVEVTFANGCTGISSEYAFGVTELNELNLLVNVYPNPSNGIFHVQLVNGSSDLKIQIRDVAGRLVMANLIPENGSLQIDMSTFSEGMYMIEVLSSGSIIDRKQIIKNDL